MSTFALVHGAWHGAWCWERLTPLLTQAGHHVVAMDLPIDDATATFDMQADVVCSALEGCDDDVVVVGHSNGGMVIPLVAARRPVRHLVFVCALVPLIGHSLAEQFLEEPGTFNEDAYAGFRPDELGRHVWVDPRLARAFMYADCDEATSDTAFERLRPHSPYPNSQPCSLTKFPDVPVSSVICTNDALLIPKRARRVARDRIGVDVVELPGSHSPFLSRPQALAEVLLRIVEE